MWSEFLRDIMNDIVTWFVVGGILISWAFGVADIIKYRWNVKEDSDV